jgi:predicted DNA-binding transcriptional regulator AlpA
VDGRDRSSGFCATTAAKNDAESQGTADDWAARLQVSKRTIFRMIDEDFIPPYDLAVGKTKRWHVETYNRWVASKLGEN